MAENETSNQIIEGRKTFFIAPDDSLLPEKYLEDFMARGYEAYIISDDRYCPLKVKIDIIIKTFRDSILFFYIDSVVEGIEWANYILDLQAKNDGNILIGVLYSKRADSEEKKQLERYYLYDVGIQCGCIGLEFQRTKNFALIDKVMFANQACGRRQNVRAICDSSSKVVFEIENMQYTGRVLDVSLSHFSATFEYPLDVTPGYKIKNMLVSINGLHFSTDALVIMSRSYSNSSMYVFVYLTPDNRQGLESDTRAKVLQKTYQMISDKVKNLLWAKFDAARKIIIKH
ncbi:hypothetical protein [Treponema sp.]|uniref:hypothetical protein n=1 Tax=Treponema sp. TaxID=166 RepID=UPI0038909E4F